MWQKVPFLMALPSYCSVRLFEAATILGNILSTLISFVKFEFIKNHKHFYKEVWLKYLKYDFVPSLSSCSKLWDKSSTSCHCREWYIPQFWYYSNSYSTSKVFAIAILLLHILIKVTCYSCCSELQIVRSVVQISSQI